MQVPLPTAALQIISVDVVTGAERWPGLAEKLDGEIECVLPKHIVLNPRHPSARRFLL
jgi:hypothetical protein